MEQRTDILLIATGEYSDYRNNAFKVLKPFTIRIVDEVFRAQWKPQYEWQDRPEPDEFIGYLAKQGYIADLPVHEVHVGSYGDLEFNDSAQLDIEFAPVPALPEGHQEA